MLNLRKKSGLHLTPAGDREYAKFLDTEIDIDPEILDIDQSIEMQIAKALPEDHDTWLMSILEEVGENSGATIEEIVQSLRNEQFPEESISFLIDALQRAIQQGLIVDREFDLPGNMPKDIARKLNMKKKAEYTYTSQLLAQMTQGLDRISANFTVNGAEAVVNFQGEGTEPQRYHIQVTPMAEIESRQEAAGERGEYSWGPEGPPPGISNASKLIMKKNALDIGGETFPDALKFKDDPEFTEHTFDNTESVPKIYNDAQNFVIGYIWDGLRAQNIIGPDNINVIQTDVDKVQFSNVSLLIKHLMEEGWFKYLEQTSYNDLKVDPNLQQKIYNLIRTEIEEGAV